MSNELDTLLAELRKDLPPFKAQWDSIAHSLSRTLDALEAMRSQRDTAYAVDTDYGDARYVADLDAEIARVLRGENGA